MMVERRQVLWLFPLLAMALFLAGCPKGPGTTTATGPALAGSAGSMYSRGGSGALVPAGVPMPFSGMPTPKDFTSISDLGEIHFAFDRYNIRPRDARILDKNAQWLRANPGSLILIEGHADERGTNEYNMALGERRAKAAMDYLIAQGIQASRFIVLSYGEEKPLCIDKTAGCWSENRRAAFLMKRS